MKKEQKEPFDFEEFEATAISKLMQGKRLGGKDGVLTPLIKRFLEKAMESELDYHLLDSRDSGNRKNGKGSKRVRTEHGPVTIQTSRDRDGSFEPELLPKRSSDLSGGIDDHIISMYSKGMSYSDIRTHLETIYGLEVSEGKISMITEQVMGDARAWQNRELDSMYVMVWMDAQHFKVRDHDNRVVSRAVYNIMGVDQHGHKTLMGMYIGTNESATFWLGVLDDLRNRGVKDMLLVSIDNLKGFEEAIEAIFPKARVQSCVVHQVRNTINYVPYKNSKEVVADVKRIYKATTLKEAEQSLMDFSNKWREKYPRVVNSWNDNWHKLSTFFDYPAEIRKMIYTTNPIESLHSQFRKITKTKRSFTNDDALLKLLYLVQKDVTSKWELRPIHNWRSIRIQLLILFKDRFINDTLY